MFRSAEQANAHVEDPIAEVGCGEIYRPAEETT
jgi:hypothetical protein